MNRTTVVLPLAVALMFLADRASGQETALQDPLSSARGMSLDDLFRLEEIHSVSFSPDGREIAFVRSRPRSSRERYTHQGREDIWIANVSGSGNTKRITRGYLDGSSYWAPSWSPDGRRLLVLTNRGFDNVHLELIDVRTGATRRVSERGINTEVGLDGLETDALPRSSISVPAMVPMLWIDNHRVLFVELAIGEGTRLIKRISAAWKRTDAGREPSFSKIDTVPSLNPRPSGRLVIVDVDTNELSEIAEGRFRKVTVSPDGNFAALIEEGAPIRNDESVPIRWPRVWHTPVSTLNFHTAFEVVSLRGQSTVRPFPDVIDPGFDCVPHGPNGSPTPGWIETYFGPKWLANGREIALLAKPNVLAKDGDTLYVVNAQDGSVRRVIHEGVAVFNIAVIGNEVFVRGTSEVASTYDPSHIYGWYSVAGTAFVKVIDAGSTPIGDLTPVTASLGIAIAPEAGGMYLIRTGKGAEFIESSDLQSASILWPNNHELSARAKGLILVRTRNGEVKAIVPEGDSVAIHPLAQADPENLWSVAIHPLAQADPGDLWSFNPRNHALAAVSQNESGTTLRVMVQGGGWRQLSTMNAFLQRVYRPMFLDLRYKAEDGRESSARLYLPPNYHKGVRIPTITWVYIQVEAKKPLFLNNSPGFDNMALAFQHGFAVLVPTINPREYDYRFEPYKSLSRDVVPAVEAAVASGVADPQQMYLFGHSYGAYSTYALIEQTDVFAAAAAINGPSDLVSDYLAIDTNFRYADWVFDHAFSNEVEIETAHHQMAMGTTLWTDFNRYSENSPVRYINRIHTPLLIF